MTFHLAISLYGMFTACLTAVWLGWQSGVYQRFLDELDAEVEERRAALWRQINAAGADSTIGEVERARQLRRRQANARIALAAMQARR